ncbi:MAG: hypothetical protein MHPSP_003449, partial [Paramarteilia canceri]
HSKKSEQIHKTKNKEIALHDQKKIEYAKIIEEQDKLKEQGLSDDKLKEIYEVRLDEYKKKIERLEKSHKRAESRSKEKNISDEDERQAKLAVAFGIKKAFIQTEKIVNNDEDKIKSFEEGSIVKQSQKNAKLVRRAKY